MEHASPGKDGSARGPPPQSSANNSLARISKTLAARLEENRQMADDLILRASASRLAGPDYYDVLCDCEVVGSIGFATFAPPLDRPWVWTLADEHHRDRSPTCGFAVTREAALTAFAKS